MAVQIHVPVDPLFLTMSPLMPLDGVA